VESRSRKALTRLREGVRAGETAQGATKRPSKVSGLLRAVSEARIIDVSVFVIDIRSINLYQMISMT